MPSDALILAFDTSAAHCAAALLRGETVLAQAEEPMAKGQGERLLPLLEEILRAGAAQWSDLDALGVGVGPGNFTGVRISVSAARGLALGLGVSAIGVSIFDARAEGLPRPLTVVENARRDQVYLQNFDGAETQPHLLDCNDLPFTSANALTGSAAQLVADLAGAPVLSPVYPLAVAIARVAQRRFGTGQPRPAPLYLRGPDAAPPSDPPPKLLA